MNTEHDRASSTPRGSRGAGRVPSVSKNTATGILELSPGSDPKQDNTDESVTPRNGQADVPNIKIQSRETSPPPHYNGPALPKEIALSLMLADILQHIYGKGTLEWMHATKCFTSATKEPPITKKSLAELDISSIINNSKLRHDVNFDRELHFRPNMDGDKGKSKREAHRGYWQAVTVELDIYQYLVSGKMTSKIGKEVVEECQKRIPKMFATIKEILTNLVPERDQQSVDQHLDVRMVMQEIEKGVCDFVSIATWLAQLLKRHCAPMRDEMVDRMVGKVRKGDSMSISTGLCEMFGVLEAMKLDVANHQIRHLRALLIEDTINFEQKYHVSRMERRRYRVQDARAWYLDGRAKFIRIPLTLSWPNRDVEAFVTTLFWSLLPSSRIHLPDTFNLDADRLRVLKVDIDNLIRENICCDILEQLVSFKGRLCSLTAKSNFKNSLQIVIGEGRHQAWSIENISAELSRHALREAGINSHFDSSLMDLAEQRLRKAFFDPQTREQYAKSFLSSFSNDLVSYVENQLTSSPWDIFNSLVAPTVPGGSIPLPPPTRIDRRADVLQRLTHIAVLHWRIWENIVYNNDELPDSLSPPSPNISRTPTPTNVMHMRPPYLPPPPTEPPAPEVETVVATAAAEATTSAEANPKDQSTSTPCP